LKGFVPSVTIASRLRIAASWSARRRALALEAAARLTRAALLVRFAPFRIAVRSGAVPIAKSRGHSSIDDIRWAVDLASRNLPWRIVCFQRGLAMQAMLRRRGIDARLHYGARHDREGALAAHVWVMVGDRVVIGEDEAEDHQSVAIFP
jgi:hypothetical protein